MTLPQQVARLLGLSPPEIAFGVVSEGTRKIKRLSPLQGSEGSPYTDTVDGRVFTGRFTLYDNQLKVTGETGHETKVVGHLRQRCDLIRKLGWRVRQTT